MGNGGLYWRGSIACYGIWLYCNLGDKITARDSDRDGSRGKSSVLNNNGKSLFNN